MLNLNSKTFYFQSVQGSGIGFERWKNCQPLKETCGQHKRNATSSEIKSNQVQSLLLLTSLAYMAKVPKRYVLQCQKIKAEKESYDREVISDVRYTSYIFSLHSQSQLQHQLRLGCNCFIQIFDFSEC